MGAVAEAADADGLSAALLRAAREEPWLPGMADLLARNWWETAGKRLGLSLEIYSTSRVLARSASAPLRITAAIRLPPAFGDVPPVLLEDLGLCDTYRNVGLVLSDVRDAGKVTGFALRLTTALDLVAELPSLAVAVGSVLRTVHVLDAPGPDHDVSYSDPAVPFSAFVGVPENDGRIAALRLAEGLVHEAMHLQLTLVEAAAPLVEGDTEKHWSPWQATMRPTRGVLHGFYVFTVLDAFFAALPGADEASPSGISHMQARRKEIRAETACAVSSLSSSRELTVFGRSFLAALLSGTSASAEPTR